MAVLTIEIPDEEIKFVTEFLKKIGGKVISMVDEESPRGQELVPKITRGDKNRKSGEKGIK